MRSDAIDQWLSSYLELPVELSFEGSVGDALRGTFEGVALEVAGVATAWLPLERIALRAARATLTPGLPAKLAVSEPLVSITVGQRDLDRWQGRFQLPFRLSLGEKGVIVHTEVAGVALSEFETGLEVVNGWFVLRPRRAAILGIPSQLASWLRAYLPLPPVSPEARLSGIDHAADRLTLHFSINDFEEKVTPGMLQRLRKRLLPWVG
ncbi:MAG TPA: hypothetical protein VKH41_10005 [Myxococcota bacterium]|nr:hypothetical protein [Myxococcota bacterium]